MHRAALPDARVMDLYIDMHAFGKGCEDFYKRSARIKTMFLMYSKESPPEIRRGLAVVLAERCRFPPRCSSS